jgi:aspartate-semialdehyde dehydrogenase
MSGLRVAVLGATGAVGREFVSLFERRTLPVGELRLLASARSAGQKIPFKGGEVSVQEVTAESFEGVDVAFFSAGAGRSREWAPVARQAGALVVDNSSAFRMDSDVPLVVPEVNWGVVRSEHRLIANPNCVAVILCMAVAPLLPLGKVKRLVVSTYQSASGGGAALMDDLVEQTRSVLDGRDVRPSVSPHPYAFNVFSHNTPIDDSGLNEEEAKVVVETRKILGRPDLGVNVTCVRVPVLRAHAESVLVEFDGEAPGEGALRDALAAFPGVRVVDDRAANRFPMPSEASGQDDVLVGRIRRDPERGDTVNLFAVGDQLLKGAALNAVQIAERWVDAFAPSAVARA